MANSRATDRTLEGDPHPEAGAAPRAAPSATADPLGSALERVGDRWSLLVIDGLLAGPQRFGDLLGGIDGLAPNILSRRLKHLEREGIVVAEPYSQRPLRHVYRLTASGGELAGVVRLLAQWGAAQPGARAGATPDIGLAHGVCGTVLDARWWCPTCAEVVDEREAEAAELRWM